MTAPWAPISRCASRRWMTSGEEGCNELLSLSRPDIIRDIHAAFFSVGCDVVETNTFGATRVVLAEYGLEDKVAEINQAAAKLAREVAKDFSGDGKPRFVAGSIGPSTKLPSLGHISFDDMAAGYHEQAAALIAGGVDVLLIETCQDVLQGKAALVGVFEALRQAGRRLPVTIQVTLEATGTMLLGTEIGAAVTEIYLGALAHRYRTPSFISRGPVAQFSPMISTSNGSSVVHAGDEVRHSGPGTSEAYLPGDLRRRRTYPQVC